LTKYIIYKEPRNESNGGHNGTNMINTKSQYKEEEKDVRNIWPRDSHSWTRSSQQICKSYICCCIISNNN